MIKRIQMALAALLFASLTLYGWAQNQSDGPLSHADEARIALERHEARVVKKLKLTPRQKSDYDKLQAWLKAESAKLPSMPNRVAYGQEINRKLHEGLKRTFTQKQYADYMRMWAPTDLRNQDPMAGGAPFAGTDEAILNELKISPAQWNQYREFRREADVRNQEFKSLMRTDPQKAGPMGTEINRWTRTSMRRILGEDDYYEWVRLWNEIMHPVMSGASSGVSPRRPTGGSSSVAGRVGG